MEKIRSVPVLISFKRLQFPDRITSKNQTCCNVTDWKRFNPATDLDQRRTLPLRSFSLCAILPERKTAVKLKLENDKEVKNVSDAELEIESSEKDFVLSLYFVFRTTNELNCVI